MLDYVAPTISSMNHLGPTGVVIVVVAIAAPLLKVGVPLLAVGIGVLGSWLIASTTQKVSTSQATTTQSVTTTTAACP